MNDNSFLDFYSQMLNLLENDYLLSLPKLKRMFSSVQEVKKATLFWELIFYDFTFILHIITVLLLFFDHAVFSPLCGLFGSTATLDQVSSSSDLCGYFLNRLKINSCMSCLGRCFCGSVSDGVPDSSK